MKNSNKPRHSARPTLSLQYYKEVTDEIKKRVKFGYIKTEFNPRINKIYIQTLSDKQFDFLCCDVLNEFDTRRIEFCEDWSEEINHYDDFLTWVDSDNVIRLKDKYTCQCIQYKKQFTLDELYIYYFKEYINI